MTNWLCRECGYSSNDMHKDQRCDSCGLTTRPESRWNGFGWARWDGTRWVDPPREKTQENTQ